MSGNKRELFSLPMNTLPSRGVNGDELPPSSSNIRHISCIDSPPPMDDTLARRPAGIGSRVGEDVLWLVGRLLE
jgi:hypothetical protein